MKNHEAPISRKPMETMKTSDLVHTAYFLAKGYKLVDCRVEAVPHVTFTIEGENLTEDNQKYSDNQGSVEPLTFQKELSYINDVLLKSLELFQANEEKSKTSKSTQGRRKL